MPLFLSLTDELTQSLLFSITLSLPLSLSLCFSLFIDASLFECLSLYLCLSLSLTIPLSHFLWMPVTSFMPLSLLHFISPSIYPYHNFFLKNSSLSPGISFNFSFFVTPDCLCLTFFYKILTVKAPKHLFLWATDLLSVNSQSTKGHSGGGVVKAVDSFARGRGFETSLSLPL